MLLDYDIAHSTCTFDEYLDFSDREYRKLINEINVHGSIDWVPRSGNSVTIGREINFDDPWGAPDRNNGYKKPKKKKPKPPRIVEKHTLANYPKPPPIDSQGKQMVWVAPGLWTHTDRRYG